MCLYPRVMKNPKYTKTAKNGGIIPPINDLRIQFVPIGCGNCIECRKQKARQWQARLLEDIKENKNGKFITLTFSNEAIKHLTEKAHEYNEKRIQALYDMKQSKTKEPKLLKGYTLDNEIATIAMRLFNERWRKTYKTAIRHWMVTELGHNGTENIHLHGIMWTDKPIEQIRRIWQYGYIWPRKDTTIKTWVNEQTINYIIKYITKKDEKHTQYQSTVLTSPGIGKNYNGKENKYNELNTKETYRTRTGHKINLPVYWRNKIYTEEQKEKLWIEKLNKQERWIMGEKIDISEGEEDYYNTLEHYRKLNKTLGYGDDTKDWNRKRYEEERRMILQETRIANARAKEANPPMSSAQESPSKRTTTHKGTG